jgi:hypothetical protein
MHESKKRQVNKRLMSEWVVSVGGFEPASDIVRETLMCSRSKADKIVNRSYPSVPQPLEQRALADLLGTTRDVLYPLADKPQGKAAS